MSSHAERRTNERRLCLDITMNLIELKRRTFMAMKNIIWFAQDIIYKYFRSGELRDVVERYNKSFDESLRSFSDTSRRFQYMFFHGSDNGVSISANSTRSTYPINTRFSEYTAVTRQDLVAKQFNFENLNSENIFAHLNLGDLDWTSLSTGDQLSRYLYHVWELEYSPAKWILQIDRFNVLFVPSKFVQKNISDCWGVKSAVLPYLVKDKTMSPVEYTPLIKRFSFKTDAVKILCMADGKSLEMRKNIIGCLSAAKQAITDLAITQDAQIIVLLRDYCPSIASQYSRFLADVDHVVINENLCDKTVAAIQNIANIFVSLHRAEGFGLSIAEALFLGQHVVATNYSGNLDFCNEGNCYLVSHRLKAVPLSAYPFSVGQRWAEPFQCDALKKIKQALFDFLQGDYSRGKSGRDTIASLNRQTINAFGFS
jgi:hypothetical protein